MSVAMRPMAAELSLLSRADGSASFHCGDETSVIACVYGPTDVRISKEQIDKATVEVLVKPKIGTTSCASKVKEEMIRNAIDSSIIGRLHPRTAVNVVVQEVQGDGSTGGSLLAASINACCLALLDAGVPMRATFAAVSCACVRRDKDDNSSIDDRLELILDPSEGQQRAALTVLVVAFESTEKKVVASHFGGRRGGGVLTDEKFQECLSLCAQAADEIFRFFRDCVKQKMSIDSPSAAKTNLVTLSTVDQVMK